MSGYYASCVVLVKRRVGRHKMRCPHPHTAQPTVEACVFALCQTPVDLFLFRSNLALRSDSQNSNKV